MTLQYLENIAKKTIDKLTNKSEKLLVNEYQQALKSIKSILSDLYDKYSSDGVLSYSEMTKYNRLAGLYKTLDFELGALSKSQDKIIKSLVGESYTTSYYRYGFSIDKSFGVDIGFGLVDKKTILSLINEPNISGKSLIDMLGQNRYDLLLRQRQTIIQGFIKGESYTKIAKTLSETFVISLDKALVIARTEGGRASTEGQVAAYQRAKENGIEIKTIWMAANDARPSHAALNEVEADSNGLFYIGSLSAEGPGLFGDPAEDINCRCTLRSEIIGYPPDNLNRDDIPNFNEWEKEQKN